MHLFAVPKSGKIIDINLPNYGVATQLHSVIVAFSVKTLLLYQQVQKILFSHLDSPDKRLL